MAWRLGHIDGTAYNIVAAVTGGNPHEPTSGGNPFAPAFHADVYEREMIRLGYARKPRRIFVGSMGDFCFEGEALAFDWSGGNRITTDSVQAHVAHFAAEISDRKHTVLALTKRPDLLVAGIVWPRNLHLGVSVTGNEDAWRVWELLRRIPVGCRRPRWGTRPGVLWASVEPLLDASFNPKRLEGLDWVVVGFDSSPGARRALRTDVVHSVAMMTAALRIVEWGRDNGVPVWCKDSVQATCTARLPRELPRAHARASGGTTRKGA
jgi:protein gp37